MEFPKCSFDFGEVGSKMDFDETLSDAEGWLLMSNSPFQLLDIDPVDKRLVFVNTSCDDSFYLTGPNRHPDTGNATWHLWSDNDDVLSKLYEIIDGLQAGRYTQISDILDSVNIALFKPPPASHHRENADRARSRDPTKHAEDVNLEGRFDSPDTATWGGPGGKSIPTQQLHGGPPQTKPSQGPSQTKPSHDGQEKEDALMARFSRENVSQTSVRRLLKDMTNLQGQKCGIEASPRGDDLFTWDVKFTDFSRETRLGADLLQYARRYGREPVLNMEMLFPQSYPFAPPFVRFIRPRFERFTGHVTVGGSVCMDLLTNSGWSPANSIESILIQVRTELTSDPQCALSTTNTDVPYDFHSALTGFKDLVRRKGWDK